MRRLRGWALTVASRRDDVEVDIGPWAPAWALRLVLAAVAALALAVAWSGPGPQPPTSVVVALGLLVAVLAWAPGLGLSGMVVLVVGARVLFGGVPPLGSTMALVLLVHLLLWLGAVAARTTRRTRVELAVLASGARETAVLQVGAQALTVVAAVVAEGGLPPGDGWRVAALLLAGVVVVLALPRPKELWWRRG
ncbi:hypothetical protein [Cellulomonas timonensis]|uniref:hypothetical protein n=1 Tax=Cellulomonas timonensis TaxID=1689271 RepID=UPI000AAA245D|nr:hypothetical protein [Cellulomonas timonensis]